MSAFRPARIALSIDLLYEAAVQPSLWRNALHELSEATGAKGALLTLSSGGQNSFVPSQGLEGAFAQFVRDGWHIRNEPMRRAAARKRLLSPVMTDETLYEPGEYDRDPMHMDFLRPNGFGGFAGLQGADSALGDVKLVLQRGYKDEPFSKREVAILAKVAPHLRRASGLALATGLARSVGALDAFSFLQVPAFLLGRGGLVIRMNERAEALVGRRGLDVVGGRLTAQPATVSSALYRLAATLADTRPACESNLPDLVRVPRPPGHGLLISGIPLVGRTPHLFQAAQAMLIAIDLDADYSRSVARFEQACGLTRAEADTAAALASGLTMSETAARRGVGLETVRSQVKSIAMKTSATNRGALVALLNRILAYPLDLP